MAAHLAVPVTDWMDVSGPVDRVVRGALVALPALAGVAAVGRTVPLDGWWGSTSAHVVLIAPPAVLCLVGALALFVVACRCASAEIVILATSLTTLSLLAVLHGVGPWFGDDGLAQAQVAGWLALPAALVVSAPILVAGTGLGWQLLRAWRAWVAVGLAGVVLLVVAIVLTSPALPPQPLRVALVATAALATMGLAARHLRLYRIGRRLASLVTAVALSALAGASLVSVLDTAYTRVWWGALLLDPVSVLLAVGAACLLLRRERSVADVLAPVVVRDPGVALELGLSQEVHAFVAALEAKDPSTRDHVIRVAEVVTRVGERARLGPDDLRSLGLGGLLHDIGKLVVPSEILTKSSSLTDEEYALIKTHAERGARLLAGSPLLESVRPLVRWHHERYDGAGYPDGLRGDQIPFPVAIISVVDAWDAMTNDRHYRDGLGEERAREVLFAEAGGQWHPRVVQLLLDELAAGRPTPAFAGAGRAGLPPDTHDGSVCPDAVPVGAPSVPAWFLEDTGAASRNQPIDR